MKSTLYYFSATGNGLAVAKGLQRRMEEVELVSIPRAMAAADTEERIAGGVIGIVSPIYMHNMPHIVSRFVERIDGAEYLYMVYTGGGDLGAGLSKTGKTFKRRGLTLSALFNVAMPSNYAPYGYPDEEKQAELFGAAEHRMDEIAQAVLGGSVHFDGSGTSFFNSHIFPGPLYQIGYRHIPTMDRGFSVDDRCTSCGICERLCPAANISLLDGRPRWGHRCEHCFGCLHWCPVQAIEYGKKSSGVPRYHHPDVTLEEIKAAAPG